MNQRPSDSRARDDVRRGRHEQVGRRSEDAEPAAGFAIGEQFPIAQAKKGAAQDADQSHGILWVRERLEQRRELLDFDRLAERAGATDFDRNLEVLERPGVNREPVFLARENQELAELPPPGIDLRANVTGDFPRFLEPLGCDAARPRS